MSNNIERENEFAVIHNKLAEVLLRLENIRLKHLQPMNLKPETTAINRAIDATGLVMAKLNKRLEVSRKLKK